MFSAHVAYPPNDISKICLKMQAFYTYFLKYRLALNSYILCLFFQKRINFPFSAYTGSRQQKEVEKGMRKCFQV
jgi:hypothetical protein